MFPFKKVEEKDSPFPPPQQPPAGIPVELVIQMRQQGYTNNQIVQTLQRDGYRSDQIFDAMNQADIKGQVNPMQPPEYEQSQFEQSPAPAMGSEREHVEELVEIIISEKWNDLVKDIRKMVEWKDAVETQIDTLTQQLKDLKENFESLHKSILERISLYDKNITTVGTDLKAMESVFAKMLPKMAENINELSRITKSMKGKPAA